MSSILTNADSQATAWVDRRRPERTSRTARTRVLICGNQPLYRAALSSLVERDRRFHVIAETTNNPDNVRRAISQGDVQLVVVDYDIAFASGQNVDALETLLDVVAPRPALVVSSSLDSDACQRAMRRGVAGIVFKTSGAEVLLAALDSAQRGQVWLDRSLLPQLFDDSHTRRSGCSEKSRVEQLTPREREIMLVACTGITNKQIANKLSISEATVRHHLGSIFAKLGVSTRAELVAFGYRHNFAAPLE